METKSIIESPIRSGPLRKKHFPFAPWTSCYGELRLNELYILPNSKSTKVTQRIELKRDTKLVLEHDRSGPFITIKSGKTELSIGTSDNSALNEWLISLCIAISRDALLSVDQFTIHATLGRGSFGKVMLVEHKQTKNMYAMKTIHKDHLNDVNSILAERNIWARVDHPFIVSLKFAFQTSTKYYFGMEYIPGGDLNSLLRNYPIMPLGQIRLCIAEIGLALEYLHSLGIVYRDIKPENIMIAADGHLKLTDFGLAKELDKNIATTFCGTPEFIAPEILAHKGYSYPVDWWQLGILTYVLFFNRSPFYHQNRLLMYRRIANESPVFPAGTDPAAVDFMRRLLAKEPRNRATFGELKHHPFWGGLDFSRVLAKEVAPQYVPDIKSNSDIQHFDIEFTDEPPVDSVAKPCLDQSVFRNFSFMADESPLAAELATE